MNDLKLLNISTTKTILERKKTRLCCHKYVLLVQLLDNSSSCSKFLVWEINGISAVTQLKCFGDYKHTRLWDILFIKGQVAKPIIIYHGVLNAKL